MVDKMNIIKDNSYLKVLEVFQQPKLSIRIASGEITYPIS